MSVEVISYDLGDPKGDRPGERRDAGGAGSTGPVARGGDSRAVGRIVHGYLPGWWFSPTLGWRSAEAWES